MRRFAFTLIEMLVVISIIALLAGLLLAGVGPLKNMAKRNTTSAICQGVQQALHVRAAALGGMIEPSEHPLAASAAPRDAFVRAGTGTVVAVNGEALGGVPLTRLNVGDQSRLLLDDDRSSDPTSPHMYGLSRREMTILGAGLTAVTGYRLLPQGTGTLASPTSNFGRVVPQPAIPPVIIGGAASTSLISTALGKAGSEGELAKLKALWTPPDDDVANLFHQNRLYRVGSTIDGTVTQGGVRYRLRGTAIYDAWGNEILYSLGAKDALIITSAGRDGHFRFHPGGDGAFQTAAEADAVAGDDKDAATDNIRIGR